MFSGLFLVGALTLSAVIVGGSTKVHQVLASREIPLTSFSCEGRPVGYYADVETQCQVYHMCDGGKQFTYQCPNTTAFHQRILVCAHWYQVNCTNPEEDFSANLLIGQRDKPFIGNEPINRPMRSWQRSGGTEPPRPSFHPTNMAFRRTLESPPLGDRVMRTSPLPPSFHHHATPPPTSLQPPFPQYPGPPVVLRLTDHRRALFVAPSPPPPTEIVVAIPLGPSSDLRAHNPPTRSHPV